MSAQKARSGGAKKSKAKVRDLAAKKSPKGGVLIGLLLPAVAPRTSQGITSPRDAASGLPTGQ